MAGMLVEVEASMLSSMCLKATSALRGAYTNKKGCHSSVCIVNLLRLSASAHQRGTALRQVARNIRDLLGESMTVLPPCTRKGKVMMESQE
jgi:hypothetical protein